MEESDLKHDAKAGLATAGEVARAAGSEAKAQGATPEMRMVGDKLGAAQDAKYAVQQAVDDVREKAAEIKEGVQVRAEAVAETTRRARVAPANIAMEMRAALAAWWGGLVTSMAMGLALGVFGVVTLIVLTIALVVGLNELVGDPQGTWIVVGVYAVAMLIAYFVMRSARSRARAEVRQRVENSKEEVRHVAAPVRSAFTGRGRAGF